MGIKLQDKYVKDFIDKEALSKIKDEVCGSYKTLMERTGEGNDFLGWIDLPKNYDRCEYEKIKAAA